MNLQVYENALRYEKGKKILGHKRNHSGLKVGEELEFQPVATPFGRFAALRCDYILEEQGVPGCISSVIMKSGEIHLGSSKLALTLKV